MTDSNSFSSSEYASNAGNQEDRSIPCGCCFFEFPFEFMVPCPNGHLFCSRCVRRQVEEILFGSLKADGSLPCMHTANCNESIPLSQFRRALPKKVIEIYEERQAQEAIIEAKLENLVYCPFCNIPYEVEECLQVLECENPKCLRASCIQCREPSHIPLLCEEAEKMSETAVRRKVEERMANAVIRKCNTCMAKLVKMGGCNRLTCTRCETTMCYVCRQTISIGDHFCDHRKQERGKPCQICNKMCSLWEIEVEDNVALDAKQEALKELANDQEPNLIDQEIGPPLVRQAQPAPPNPSRRLEEHIFHLLRQAQAQPVAPNPSRRLEGHILKRLRQRVGDQFANKAPRRFIRRDDQLANMHLQTNENDGSQGQTDEDKETMKDADLQKK